MDIRIIQTGTKEYEEMINLRMKVLLDPIGIPRSYIHPEKEKNDILIATFTENKMTGCCILSKTDSETLQLRQMAVDHQIQNTGLGRMIVLYAEETAIKRGYKKIMMHARDAVLDFYKKCGYSIVGKQFFEVGIGHHKMEKELL